MSIDQDNRIPIRESLGFVLLVWFIIISIVPLSISEYYNYQDHVEQLERTYKKDLQTTALSHEIFINNWFKYRKSDVEIWSQTQNNIDLFTSLNKIYKRSASMKSYLESYDYAVIIDKYEGDLINIIKQYDYLYDFLFIDLDGNILYSGKKEDDLGLNLLKGSLSSTKLALSFYKTIKTGGICFSDLELYAPSSNIISGFLTAPIIDNNGDLKGVMALQIEANRVKTTLDAKTEGHYHYLVGEDNILRSDLSVKHRALAAKIDNKYSKHLKHGEKDYDEQFLSYVNPEGNMVMGIHKTIHILGVDWVLVSEVSHKLIFADKGEVFTKLMLFFLIMIAIIILIAIYLSKIITQPIRELKDSSILFAHGNRDTSIIQNFKGEVGELARAFKTMIISLHSKEAELKKFANELEERVKQEVSLNTIKDKQLLEQSKIAQQKLNKSLNQFSENVISSRSDINGIITFVSKALCNISGYTEDEILGKPHSILRHTDMESKVFKELWETIQSGRPWDGEIKNKTKDGKTYWVRSSVIPDFDDDHNIIGYTSIRHDITSQKAKEQFMANMSHELRTPLNAIIGFGGILCERLKDATNAKFIGLINTSSASLLSLIDNILDLSKIKDSKFSINPYEFNGYKEISEYSEQFQGLTAQKNLSLKSSISTDLEANFFGDWIRISQILLNLISNSIKFTPKGGEISYTVAYEDDCLLLIVSDNGIGMSPEAQDKIFKPFEQADGSTTREYGGTGLGLTIVQSLVDLMNGKIELESEVGKGTTFKVTLPLKKVEKISSKSDQTTPKVIIDKESLSGVHVLVAEDDEVNQLLIEVVLAQLGLTCDMANDGVEAVDMYDPAVHHLILIDKDMPNMNGVEAMQKIKQKHQDKCGPIIALTAHVMEGDKQRFLDLGMDGYVPKPIDKDELYRVIKALLNK